jgi:hypothetical protein
MTGLMGHTNYYVRAYVTNQGEQDTEALCYSPPLLLYRQ